jgi:uncharacterized protein HemX
MEKQNKQKTSNFWLGFSLGGVALGLGVFLFGTKKGREMLVKILQLTENLEENLIALEKYIEKELANNKNDLKEELKKTSRNIRNDYSSLTGLLEKIKFLSP